MGLDEEADFVNHPELNWHKTTLEGRSSSGILLQQLVHFVTLPVPLWLT